MCGILLSIRAGTRTGDAYDDIWKKLCRANAARGTQEQNNVKFVSVQSRFPGPDAQDTCEMVVPTGEQSHMELHFFASELRLRGNEPIVQPHRNEECVFCWNGEVCTRSLLTSFVLLIFTFLGI